MNIPGKGATKIRWSRGEDAEAVARRFLAENQLPESHLRGTLQYVQLAMASAAPAAASGSADYSYPVVDLDGHRPLPIVLNSSRKIMISWKRGDDPVQVAQAFARQHGYAAGPIGDIARFVQAMQVPASECLPRSSHFIFAVILYFESFVGVDVLIFSKYSYNGR